MPFNGSGIFSLASSISSGDAQSAAVVMSILEDMRDGLTNAVTKDGQSTMTGVMKAANGTNSAPSYTFGTDENTGFYRSASDTVGFSAGGSLVFSYTTTGLTIASGKSLTGAWAYLPTGTKCLFQQTAAPTGWTKDTSNGGRALRVTAGTVTTGGTLDFTTAFASKPVAGTVGGTAISQAQLPAITLTTNLEYDANIAGGGSRAAYVRGTGSPSDNKASSTLGSGETHTHTFTGTAIDLDVKFIDVIIATKS